MPGWGLGVGLSLAGCSISNLGVNMQKLSHTKLQQKMAASGGALNMNGDIEAGLQASHSSAACDAPSGTNLKPSPSPYFKQPLWLGGLGCVVFGSLMDLVSFAFASLSLLAPLGAMTLVVNLMIAPCFLGEKLTRRDFVATAVILCGTITSVVFGSKDSPDHSLSELLRLYIKAPFIVYILLVIAFLIGTHMYAQSIRDRMETGQVSPVERRFESFSYPAMAGTFGAQSVLFAKSCAEIVRMTAQGHNQLSEPGAYMMLLGMGVCVVVQMRLLNAGLERADALLVVPIYQVFWVLGNVLTGMTYFQEYHDMSWTQLIIFYLGCIITLVGIYLLSKRTVTLNPDKTPAHSSISRSNDPASSQLSAASAAYSSLRHIVAHEGDEDSSGYCSEQLVPMARTRSRSDSSTVSIGFHSIVLEPDDQAAMGAQPPKITLATALLSNSRPSSRASSSHSLL